MFWDFFRKFLFFLETFLGFKIGFSQKGFFSSLKIIIILF